VQACNRTTDLVQVGWMFYDTAVSLSRLDVPAGIVTHCHALSLSLLMLVLGQATMAQFSLLPHCSVTTITYCHSIRLYKSRLCQICRLRLLVPRAVVSRPLQQSRMLERGGGLRLRRLVKTSMSIRSGRAASHLLCGGFFLLLRPGLCDLGALEDRGSSNGNEPLLPFFHHFRCR
jgi:hypothetical protein